MLRVFLVDDERAVRENLRDSIAERLPELQKQRAEALVTKQQEEKAAAEKQQTEQ